MAVMRKTLVFILVTTMISLSWAVDLPDAPSATRKPTPIVKPQTVFPPDRASFSERNRTKIIIWGIVIGATVGIIVGVLKHSGKCPSRIFYEGKWYPYSGTYDDQHACPTEPPNAEPDR